MLPFGATGSGESDAVICMSACGVTYCVETTAALLALFGSAESLLVVNVSLMVWLLMPNCAEPALSTIVKTDVVRPKLAAVQVNEAPCPTESDGQLQPAGTVIDCHSSVLLRITDMCAFVVASGPAFVTFTVYVMLPSGATGSGESDAVICMSACGVTYCVDTVAVLLALFPSPQSLVTVKTSLIVWLLMPNCAEPAFRTIVKVDVVNAKLAAVHVNDAPCPTASDGQLHPAGTVIDCQRSVPFSTTFRCAFVVASGPAFVTVTV